MDKETALRVQEQLDEDIKGRFPAGTIQRVTILQYGDDPVVEPGRIVLRVVVAAGEGKEERERVGREFEASFREQIQQLRHDLRDKLPDASRIEIRVGEGGEGPRFMMAWPERSVEARALAGADLTPVMARLGAVDLETLDTLINAGIAGNRADAVRWALARIRERPAYAELRAKAAEIEQLKSQF